MNRFIKELRRREVFRTAGLYVGICWIGIEAASIVLPTFDAPEWVLRGVIIAAVAGFPVMLVLAWFYDVSGHGIEKTANPTDTVVAPIGRGKGDYLVIGVLTVALIFSVYLNITRTGSSGPPVVIDPISVLIADFDNQTGDSVFDGSIELPFQIGLESAPFVTTFNRNAARTVVAQIRPGESLLDEETARLVSVREGIDVVISGEIREKGRGYELMVRVVDGATGEEISDADSEARNKSEVLNSVSEIADTVRRSLGDTAGGDGQVESIETFTATSLEAVQAYTEAQLAALNGDYEGSLDLYAKAVEFDENFGRAFSGWALSLFTLGRTEEAEAKWEVALSKMGSMTERERLRTLGLYYVAIAGNYERAIETYSDLVERYPADNAGRNNLAIASFAMLDFETALEQGRMALDVYPNNEIMRSNLALYAMYAGDFDTARSEAESLLEDSSDYFTALLPVAMAANADGDWPQAETAYTQMATGGARGASLANLGLADLALFGADVNAATGLLETGIADDAETGNQRSAAIKRVMLAKALALGGDSDAARSQLELATETSGLAIQVPAALTLIELGDHDAALAIADTYSESLSEQSRAYANLIRAMVSLNDGKFIEALDLLRDGIELADLWLLRYYRGVAYLESGAFVEALDELRLAESRIGEATAVFLDDSPTWHFTALLPYWLARAESQLGMQAESQANLEYFVSYRRTGPETEDARSRLP